MTAVLPERPAVLSGADLNRRVPAWITDLDLIASILDGHIDIPDDLNPQKEAKP